MNDISILENFTKTNITMKCTNKYTYTFEGFGRFNGISTDTKLHLKRYLIPKTLTKI